MTFAAELAQSERQDIAAARAELMEIIRARSFRQGQFTLASGRVSDLYFNMKPTMMNARGAELSARCLMALLDGFRFDYIGGLEMGAVPVIGSIAALSSLGGRPVETIFVRKEKKGHGTRDLVEGLASGESLDGKTVLVVDDVATSGGSFLKAVDAVREAGATVSQALCLIDREEGAKAFLEERGVALASVFKGAEFRQPA
jgi:orotate phosphoribosyltransferase